MTPNEYFKKFQEEFSSPCFFALLKELSQYTTWVERKRAGHYKIVDEERVMDYLQSYAKKHENIFFFNEEKSCCCCHQCCKRSF